MSTFAWARIASMRHKYKVQEATEVAVRINALQEEIIKSNSSVNKSPRSYGRIY